MNKHACKALVLILGFLVLSCSRSATPTYIPSSKIACSSGTQCVDPTETCDLLFPSQAGGTGGTCRKKCNPNGPTTCSGGDVCNPITGACDTTCAGQVSGFCASQLPKNSSVASVCVNSSYCAFSDANPGQNDCIQIPGLKSSGGFCKVACSSNTDCSGAWQTCDAITGTCEVACDATLAKNTCPASNYSVSGAQQSTSVTLACSPITSTCVQQCSTAAGGATCSDAVRGSCYVPGGTLNTVAQFGTCEVSCKGPASCFSASGEFKCAEGFCQQSCTGLVTDCGGDPTKSGRTTCDVISGVCRTGCSTANPCATTGMICSPITSTCVQQCTLSGAVCLTGDIRSQCYAAGAQPSGAPGSCEEPCGAGSLCPATTVGTIFPQGLQCEEGICQQKCHVINSDCLQNTDSGRTTCDLVSSVCRQGCSSGIQCPINSGLSCSIVSGTCVATCISGTTVCPTNRNTCVTPAAAAATYGPTCEMGCTSKGSSCLSPNTQLLCEDYLFIMTSQPSSAYFCLINSTTTGTNGFCPVGLSGGVYCGYSN